MPTVLRTTIPSYQLLSSGISAHLQYMYVVPLTILFLASINFLSFGVSAATFSLRTYIIQCKILEGETFGEFGELSVISQSFLVQTFLL